MKKQLRSSFSTQGRRMAGARALWAANGMKKNQMGKPIIAIVNSFTQFVPGQDVYKRQATMVPFPGRAKPMASFRQFIEFAVNIPEQHPQVGQAFCSILATS